MPFRDSLGACVFDVPHDPTTMMRLLNGTTDRGMTWNEAVDVGLRSFNLLRAFNIRQDHDLAKDAPSPRYGGIPTVDLGEGKDIRAQWKETLETLCDEMGRDRATDKPRPETLKRLGLDFVIPDLWPSWYVHRRSQPNRHRTGWERRIVSCYNCPRLAG